MRRYLTGALTAATALTLIGAPGARAADVTLTYAMLSLIHI